LNLLFTIFLQFSLLFIMWHCWTRMFLLQNF